MNRLLPSGETASRTATKILLIEDDAADAVLFERLLSKCIGEYVFATCEDLHSGLTWLDANTCDAVMLDRSLPDSFGVDGIEKIHRRCADLPIVILTGFDDDATALDALDHGAQDYLIKGKTSAHELERTVRYAIQRQQIQNENRRLLQELEKAAKSDSLTGVLNRHALMSEFSRHWKEAAEQDFPLTCVILDIDFFKTINDQFGHIAGDEVLRQFAYIIGSQVHKGHCLARYGGEEFCVVLPNTDEQVATEWAENVRATLNQYQFDLSGEPRTVTASFGVGQQTDTTTTIEQLIDRADQALLFSKKSGRNRVTKASDLNQPAKDSTDKPPQLTDLPARPVAPVDISIAFPANGK